MSWVIVEGGLVQDSSRGVQVFDLDFMSDEFIDHHTIQEAWDTYDRLRAANLPGYASRVRAWLKVQDPDEHETRMIVEELSR